MPNTTITADTTPGRLALIASDLYSSGELLPSATGNAGTAQITVPAELAALLRAELDTRGIAHD